MFVFVPHIVQCCCQTEKITTVDSCTPVISLFFLQCSFSFCLAFVVEVAAIISKLEVILDEDLSLDGQCVSAKLSDWHEETAWLWAGNTSGKDAEAVQTSVVGCKASDLFFFFHGVLDLSLQQRYLLFQNYFSDICPSGSIGRRRNFILFQLPLLGT